MTKWTVVLAVSLACVGLARAAGGPDDQYLDIYDEILHADGAAQNGFARDAAIQYSQVQQELQKFKAEYPTWNPEVIDFRLQYTAEQLRKFQDYLPVARPAPAVAQNTNAAPAKPEAAPTAELTDLRQQIQTLLAANNDLENRLKEALSVQPAAVSPVELQKAQQRIVALEKERDLLKVALDQAKATPPSQSEPLRDESAAKLKKELAAREKELAAVEKHYKHDLADARTALDKSEEQRAELQKKLDSIPAAPPVDHSALKQEVEQLRARLVVLEAQAVPYTAEELAVLKSAQQPTATALPAPVAAPKKIGHSREDLPPGAGALMAEAMRAVMERDYPEAESKFKEILRQDENNVYVLAYLANSQLAEKHLTECEKTVQRALKLDPDDPASLYLLGVVRFEQARYDDALNALSRSAQLNPTNSNTQNYLGCVLAQKGERAAAETALRKALAVDPGNADANYNLAFIYATEKPPSPQLASWHYQRALSLGHPKSADLEKLLPAN